MNELYELNEQVPVSTLRIKQYVEKHNLLGEIVYRPTKPFDIAYDTQTGAFCGTKGYFTYYVTFLEKQFSDPSKFEEIWLSKKEREKFISYSNNWVADLENWHCGVTFYEKKITDSFYDDPLKVVKFGCDYNHYWDEGKNYEFWEIQRDLDALLEEIHQLPWIKKEHE
jgi:hypothetical protein